MQLQLLFCFLFVMSTVQAQEWWKTAILYQIYPRSFKDSDGDGVGDIKGITSKADYLKDIGVNAVWLSPIYESPMADFGYDISNFTDIDPIFGNLNDFKELLDALKERGIRTIMDFVPNHSSNKHPWFQKSIKEEAKYKDYYVWVNKSGDNEDGSPKEPNNWLSLFGGSAWTWNEERQQFYLHQFAVEQPDLNYRNPDVVEDMKASLAFWLDLGVDGYRIDAIKYLIEDEKFRDEELIDKDGGYNYDNLDHVYTTNQNLTYSFIEGWNELVNERNKDGKGRLILLEVYNPLSQMVNYYGGEAYPFAMPFNFHLLDVINEEVTAINLTKNIKDWMGTVPSYGVPNWVVGNHDNSRVASRVGVELADSINMLLAMLPGIMITYNGEEIGMTDTFIRFEETVDVRGLNAGKENYKSKTIGSRDPERTAMQWDCSENAGFSTHTPWLPINPNYWTLNVADQLSEKNSHLKVYKNMSHLRNSGELLANWTENDMKVINTDVFFLQRHSKRGNIFVLLINFGCCSVNVWPLDSESKMTVHTSSINAGYAEGDMVTKLELVKLRPKAGVVLRTLGEA